MKNKIMPFLLSWATILVLYIIFAIIINSFFHFNLISNQTYNIIINIISALSLFIGGIVLGAKSHQKGLFQGLIMFGSYIIIVLLFNFLSENKDYNLIKLLFLVARSLLLILGSVIGVNVLGSKYIETANQNN